MQDSARAPTAQLLERDREIERLDQALTEADAGMGATIALEGEAGIGKSSLLAHAVGAASDRGMRVLRARGGELEQEFAYGVVRQLFEAPLAEARPADRDRWLTGAAGLAGPVVSASAPALESGPGRGGVLHGLYWLAANLSLERPLLLAIDDAHWADDVSIEFLGYLARRVDELAVLIVYASRIGEGKADALPAVAEPALAHGVLRPPALSEEATAKLVARQHPSASSARFASACHATTGGNPFLLGELLRALQADGIMPDDSSTTRVEQIAPATVARATLARLRRLGPAANALAFAVAVLGTSAELRLAAAIAELEVEVAARAADALAGAAILRDGRPLQFIHPIVRTTIYSELAPGRRAASHKRAARLLEHDGASDLALAPHLLATDPDGDSWVVERLRSAAREVLTHAPAAAHTYLERAHREPAPTPDRVAVLLALADAELQVSTEVVDRATAIRHVREVLDRAPDTETRFEAARLLVGALTLNGQMPEAIEVGRELVAGAAPKDEQLKLRLEGELALLAQFFPRHAKAAIERLAGYKGKLAGETSGERLILTCLAFGGAHGGESAAVTAELARRALRGTSLVDEHRPGSPAMFLAAWALIYAEHLDEAERLFDRAIEHARKRGWEGEFCSASGNHAHVLVRQGRLAEAEAEALGVLAIAGPTTIARAMLLSCLLQTMTERAEPRTWQPFLIEHGLDGDLTGRAMGGMLLSARGHLRLAAGDAHAALADFEELHRRDERSGLHTPAIPSLAPQALAHLQLGRRDTARKLAHAELELARRWNTPSALAYALRAAGLVEGGNAGIDLLRRSVAAVEGSQARYEHARSLTELGAALRRASRRSDARDALREGLDLADRCGATRLAGRARDELLATGARPRRTALRGRDALTPSERRVAQLAADGLSNRDIAQALFVTVRTVEGHLTHTYMKLDIAARDDLAVALATTSD